MHDTNLVSPALPIALRGFKAIKQYFETKINDAGNLESDDEAQETQASHRSQVTKELEIQREESKSEQLSMVKESEVEQVKNVFGFPMGQVVVR